MIFNSKKKLNALCRIIYFIWLGLINNTNANSAMHPKNKTSPNWNVNLIDNRIKVKFTSNGLSVI